MDLAKLLRAQTIQLKGLAWRQTLVVMTVLLGITLLPVWLIHETHQNVQTAKESAGGLARLVLGISVLALQYRFVKGNALHRARLEGVSRWDWLALISWQATLSSLIYTGLYFVFIGLVSWFSLGSWVAYASEASQIQLLVHGLHFFLLLFVLYTLGMTLSLYVKAYVVPLLVIAWMAIEIISKEQLGDSMNETLKSFLLIRQFRSPTFSDIWLSVRSLLVYLILTQLVLVYKSTRLHPQTHP